MLILITVTNTLISKGGNVYRAFGTGDPKNFCLKLVNNKGLKCGLGDHIQSLPVIAELLKLGYTITVYANPFYKDLYERMGIEFHSHEELCFGWNEIYGDKYGAIYSLLEWSIDDDAATGGNSVTDRVSLFASWFGIKRPTSFDFRPYFQAVENKRMKDAEYIVFAPESGSTLRTLKNGNEIYSQLRKSHSFIYHLGQQSGRTVVQTLDELVEIIFNAKGVLSTDSGVLHLALSLGVSTYGVFGMSDENIICEPYDYYVSGKKKFEHFYPELKACECPCSSRIEKGRTPDKCQVNADCLSTIKPLSLVENFNHFIRSN